ncbi:MAG: Maf family protein [Syntrophales bacterium]|nr:Maf family protein [Syntrophales bacterium]
MGLIVSGRFILASASPRRVELLKLAGLRFDVVPARVNETCMEGETPEEHVLRLSEEKAKAIAGRNPGAWVLGADTVVLIHSEILGKPRTISAAKEMLSKLSGQEHRVLTGFTIAREAAGILVRDVVVSWVTFKDIPEDEIAWYIRSDEPYDKAGGYAVQGKGSLFIREIRGSYTNVMGLPLCEVVEALKGLGAIEFAEENHGTDSPGQH